MRAVTFVIDNLDYTGRARQVSLLAPAMQAAGRRVRVVSLSGDGQFGDVIRSAGVLVEGVRPGRRLDPSRFLALRQVIRNAPDDSFHVFGLPAFRWVSASAIGLKRPSFVLTLSGHERLSPFDRGIVRSCKWITVPHSEAAEAIRGQRVAAPVEVVPPAVAESHTSLNRVETCRSFGLPSIAHLIISVSRLQRQSDLFWTLWLYTYVHYLKTGARLLVVGDGPGRDDLEDVALGLTPEGTSISFLGARSDVPGLMSLSEIAMVIRPRGGMNVALEAMAAGVAVVAEDTSDLRSIVRHGETGFLIPRQQILDASRTIRQLLSNRAERLRIGNAAREWVRERHGIATVRSLYERLYET
jgi:glycosyltransferase involved in cell wall biosynthesis